MIVAARNRKLYSLVLSCTHHGKIPAEKFGFLCFLVFYLFVQAFPVQVKPVRATPAQEKPFLDKKAPKAGNLERYLAGHTVQIRFECAQTGAFLAATGAVCGDGVAWYFRTTSCRRVKFIYWFVGLFLCVNPVMSVSQFCNETKAAHLFKRCG